MAKVTQANGRPFHMQYRCKGRFGFADGYLGTVYADYPYCDQCCPASTSCYVHTRARFFRELCTIGQQRMYRALHPDDNMPAADVFTTANMLAGIAARIREWDGCDPATAAEYQEQVAAHAGTLGGDLFWIERLSTPEGRQTR